LISEMGEQTKFCGYSFKEIDSADKMREFMKDEEEIKEGYFQNIDSTINPLEDDLTKVLNITTPLSTEQAQALVDFFKDRSCIKKAEIIYEKYGFTGLLDYKHSLIKKEKLL